MRAFVTSISKSLTFCDGLFLGLSVIPELVLIGVNCVAFLHTSSIDHDQCRLIIWSLSLACIILLLKAVQLPLLSIYKTYNHPNGLFPMLSIWVVLNLLNFVFGMLILIHLNEEKKEVSLRQSYLRTNIALSSTVLVFLLSVCCFTIGRIWWVIHQDNNRL